MKQKYSYLVLMLAFFFHQAAYSLDTLQKRQCQHRHHIPIVSNQLNTTRFFQYRL